jgi:hypothetical protein
MPAFPLAKEPVYYEYFEDKKKIREYDEDATEALREQEIALWKVLWRRPQAAAWNELGLKYQVAAYVRSFLGSVKVDAPAGLKTAVLRMETELGLSVAGMRQNGWRIGAGVKASEAPSDPSPTARRTSSGEWLKSVSVEGA